MIDVSYSCMFSSKPSVLFLTRLSQLYCCVQVVVARMKRMKHKEARGIFLKQASKTRSSGPDLRHKDFLLPTYGSDRMSHKKVRD